MTRGVVNAELIEDEFGNALGGSEIGFPAMCLCTFFEQLDELLSVPLINFRVRTLVPVVVRAFQTFYSLFFQR